MTATSSGPHRGREASRCCHSVPDVTPCRSCFRVGRSDPARQGMAARSLVKALARSFAHGQVSSRRRVSPLRLVDEVVRPRAAPGSAWSSARPWPGALEADHLAPGQQRPAMREVATQASLRTKESKGRLARPQSFQFLIRSSTRACPRWRSSRVAMSSPSVLVMKQVWRNPSTVSNKGELGPGVGTLPSHDQPGLLRPGGERDQVGQLGHPGAVADRAVGLSGLDPVLLLDEEHSVTNSLVDGESDGEVAVGGH